MRRATLAMLFALVLGACRPSADTPRGVAQRFVDAHYVQIDLAAAKTYCSGVATRKLEEEAELTRGQVIDESTRKPRINYSLLETRPEGEDRVSFLFEGSIRVEDAEAFSRKWLVTTLKDGGAWKVSNYQEFE